MATPNNLPAQLSSFVGRELQLAELRRLLRKSRLITLTGPGGAGKTRLALRLAETVLDRYPDGVWLVGLSAFDDARLVEQSVAASCGVREVRRRPMLEVLAERLRPQRTLLILDGCEHLVDACAAMVDQLLRSCPELTVVVTSREPLGVPGELTWRIPSLTVPGLVNDARKEVLLKSEAVLLFIDRARLAQPGFNLDRNSSAELADICVRLDGLPLAIELAASLVDSLTVHEISGRLGNRFRLLTGGSRGGMARHQTLRQAVDWSYGFLSPEEKALLAQLSVFAGGFDVDAAEAIGGVDSATSAEVLPLLLRLVDKSLVIAEGRDPSRMRYRLLDTIREYALEKLQEGDSDGARRRHAMYFVEFCTQAEAKLRHREQTYWLGRIEDEEANIRLALAWCQTEAPEKLLLLSRCMYRFWFVRGKFTEGLEWLDIAVEAAESPDAKVAPLLRRANLRRHHGDYEGAQRDAEECAQLARQQGLDRELMLARNTLGVLSGATGKYGDAGRYFRESLELAEQLGDTSFIAGCLNNLAIVDSSLGNHEAAQALLDRALQVAGKDDDPRPAAVILETAGRIARRFGALDVARQKYLQGLRISTEIEDLVNIVDILEGLALLALSEGDPARTLVLIAASSRQRAITNSERSPLDESEVEQGAREAKARLSQITADSAWQRGSALNLTRAIAFASGTTVDRISNGGPALSAREMQVASLIAEGLTNLEIASRLKIAGRTADAHVEHIRNKLGLRTRAQIAVWAHDQ